jgi:hypothetical protein
MAALRRLHWANCPKKSKQRPKQYAADHSPHPGKLPSVATIE